MAILKYRGKAYDITTVGQAMEVMEKKTHICVGTWSGYAYIGTVAGFLRKVRSIDKEYGFEHYMRELQSYDPKELSEIEDSCKTEKELEAKIAELDTCPYIPLCDRPVSDFSVHYVRGKEYLAIHVEPVENFGLW